MKNTASKLDQRIKALKKTLQSANSVNYMANAKKGLSRELVEYISKEKNEPVWMKELRLKSLETFFKKPMPSFGPDLSGLNLEGIIYYAKPGEILNSNSWDRVPDDIKKTFERLGIPQAEREYLAGAGAQYESENVYHKLKEKWAAFGVIFEDMDTALKLYPDLVRQYFMKCVGANEHKFAALHGAVWSGGTFIYIPEGVTVDQPLQAYFRMNASGMGQFEHTIIVVGKAARGSYIEGCSAPKYESPSLHAGMVEIFVQEGGSFRYSSVENWSLNTYNLNTKRAIVEKNGSIEWIGGNLGSKATMLYPCSILKGEGARANHIGMAYANRNQTQDTGAKIVHAAPNTTSKIVMKSICKNGGSSIYRGDVKILKGAHGASTHIKCDSLLLDDISHAQTVPGLDVKENDVFASHEASVGKIAEDKLFYCMSRGMSEDEAVGLIVNGFIEPIIKEMPLEYAVELIRLMDIS